jgi:hypothetical protein
MCATMPVEKNMLKHQYDLNGRKKNNCGFYRTIPPIGPGCGTQGLKKAQWPSAEFVLPPNLADHHFLGGGGQVPGAPSEGHSNFRLAA